MSAHVFLFARAQGRWREAFDEAVVASGPADALRLADRTTIVWVDIAEMGWIAELRSERPDLLIVAMSLAPTATEALTAFEAGARGYCHALGVPEMLRQIALVVSNGGLWVGSDLMSRAASAVAKASGPPVEAISCLAGLTPRERDVALQVVQGACNKEVARRLGITARTVKAHMGAIFDKLGVRDRLQLALLLRRSSPAPAPMAEVA